MVGGSGGSDETPAAIYFALAVVAYDEEEIAAVLAQLRKDQQLGERFEYHFSEGPTKTDRIRLAFMQAVKQSSMRAAILSGSKAALSLNKDHHGIAFLSASICELLTELPLEQIDGVSMVIDGTKGETKKLCDGIMSHFKQWPYRPKRPRGMGSHQCDGIQIADMLAGAARHRVAGKTPDYLESLTAKINLKEAK